MNYLTQLAWNDALKAQYTNMLCDHYSNIIISCNQILIDIHMFVHITIGEYLSFKGVVLANDSVIQITKIGKYYEGL